MEGEGKPFSWKSLKWLNQRWEAHGLSQQWEKWVESINPKRNTIHGGYEGSRELNLHIYNLTKLTFRHSVVCA